MSANQRWLLTNLLKREDKLCPKLVVKLCPCCVDGHSVNNNNNNNNNNNDNDNSNNNNIFYLKRVTPKSRVAMLKCSTVGKCVILTSSSLWLCFWFGPGMESLKIPDASITASSSKSMYFRPSEGRLNDLHVRRKGSGGWCIAESAHNQDPYLQIDLGSSHRVTKVATQGHPVLQRWVSNYRLLYSTNGVNWLKYKFNGTEKVWVIIC